MTSISSFSQSLISKESALNFITAAGSSLLSARFIPVTIKESAIVGGYIAALSSTGNALIGKDASDFKKIIVKTAALALTFYGALSFAPIINARFAVALTPQSITNMLAFHAFGQVVSFALAKTFFITPWNMSDRQIQKLYAKCEENPEQFKEFSTPEQQLLYRRFIELGLNISKLSPAKPTTEEIATLSDKQISTLYQYNVFFTEEGSQALLLRYFELNLSYRTEFACEIKTLPLSIPTVIEEMSKEQLTWFKPLVRWIGIEPKTQETLAKRAKELELNTPPVHPKTPEEVNQLSEDIVRAYHSELIPHLSKEVTAAFNRRFYDFRLPLPNGIQTIDNLEQQEIWSFPEINILAPTTVEEINALHDNQLPWVYSAFVANNPSFCSLSFDAQEAINARFESTGNGLRQFSLDKLTADGIRRTSKENIHRILHSIRSYIVWVQLAPEVIEALNARASEVEHKPTILSEIPLDSLLECEIHGYYEFFKNVQPANWTALPREKQQQFNSSFKAVNLEPLTLQWW